MTRRASVPVLFGIGVLVAALGAEPSKPVAAAELRVDTLAVVDGGSGGLSVDAAGNVYSSDFGSMLSGGGVGGDRVFRITPGGETSVFATGLRGASGSGIDSEGNLFQSNIGGGYLTKITPDGETSVFSREGFRAPVGIEIDPDDTLWVANCGTGSIQRVTAEGVSSLFVESELLKCPNGLERDDAGNLYASNFYDGNVVKITPAGEASVLATLPGSNNGHLLHHEGRLYVIARSAHQVYEVGLDGSVELLAGSGEKGGRDGRAREASFCYPNDLGLSPDGRILYVNDVGDESSTGQLLAPTRIRRIHLAN